AQANFQDLVYQTKANASGPNPNTGRAGVNAQQIGLGASLASIYSNVTSAGSAETTGNPFDIRINGESFFIVSDGNSQFYTRSGAFTVDADGTLCMSSNGYTVQGYDVVENNGEQQINTSALVPLKIMSAKNKTSDPMATSKGYMTGILDSNSDALTQSTGQVVDMKIYDNEGYRYTVKYKILPNTRDVTGVYVDPNGKETATQQTHYKHKTDGSYITNEQYAALDATAKANYEAYTNPNKQQVIKGEFKMTITDMLDSNGVSIFRDMDTATENEETYAEAREKFFSRALMTGGSVQEQGAANGNPIVVTFDTKTGACQSPTNDTKNSVGFNLNLNALIGVIDKAKSSATPLTDPANQLKSIPTDAFTKNIVVDLSTLKNIDNKGTSTINGGNGGVNSTEGSGWSVGTLSSVSVGVDGRITGSYTNGQTRLLGQIASAIFSNASGLEKAGDNLYVETMNSGAPVIGDVTANGGSYASGELEMSNVDLSAEFTTMITTQRGFQANSRIITVSDTLLEELINLKR
nr:flagellar hook-basal body complex protein [Lachnospiraceae bacterium]